MLYQIRERKRIPEASLFIHKKLQLNIFQHAGKFAQFTPLRLAFALLSQVFKNSFLGYLRFLVTMMKILLFLPQWKK